MAPRVACTNPAYFPVRVKSVQRLRTTVPRSVPDDFVVRLVKDPVRTGIIGPGGNVII